MVQPRRRTGRHIKKPERYTPEETVLEDDYTNEEYDSDIVGSEIDTEEEIYSDEESEDDEDDHNGPSSPYVEKYNEYDSQESDQDY